MFKVLLPLGSINGYNCNPAVTCRAEWMSWRDVSTRSVVLAYHDGRFGQQRPAPNGQSLWRAGLRRHRTKIEIPTVRKCLALQLFSRASTSVLSIRRLFSAAKSRIFITEDLNQCTCCRLCKRHLRRPKILKAVFQNRVVVGYPARKEQDGKTIEVVHSSSVEISTYKIYIRTIRTGHLVSSGQ